MALIGLAAAALGVPYVLHAFGPTEAEVVSWGRVCIGAGSAVTLLTLVMSSSRAAWVRLVLGVGFGLLGLLQAPPAALWVIFHGAGISDGSPPSPFVAHWAYALPHALVLLLCLGLACCVMRRPQPQVRDTRS